MFSSISGVSPLVEMEKFGAIMWSIWFDRNVWVHSSICFNIDETISRGRQMTNGMNREDAGPNCRSGARLEATEKPRWTPPSYGSYKMNVDASIRKI